MKDFEEQHSLVTVINSELVSTTLKDISAPLEAFAKYNNLPTENVLANGAEKVKLFNMLPSVLESLPQNKREKAEYLTKFIVSSAVGLFDGALNFLWNEIIKSLRETVVEYDLIYFYSVAEQINSRYKNLNNVTDLEYISDLDFLIIIKRIGFIDDIGFKTLEHMNYLRNHSSAAHPNINELSGIKLVSLLEDGIKYGILLEPDVSVVDIKQLFENIRKYEISIEDIDCMAEDLKKHPLTRMDDFTRSIFGVYCDDKTSKATCDNIIELSKRLWSEISENTKYEIGSKFGYYRNNGDIIKKDKVNNYLESVSGLKYKDEDSIVSELIEKLNHLKSVHFGINNFYYEYSYAKDIEKMIPEKGVPKTVKRQFIKVICMCYAGNGQGYREGVDENAEEIYNKFIDDFDSDDIYQFIQLFDDNDFTIDFYKTKPKERLKKLCIRLMGKTENDDVKAGLDLIIKNSNTDLRNLRLLTPYIELMKK